MSSQKPPPSDFTPEDPVEYVDGDDDEDSNDEEYHEDDGEEEDEFVPDYDDADDEEDGAIVPLLDGILSVDRENILHYRGDGFHLASIKPLDCNLLSSAANPAIRVYAFVMEGPCDIESVSGTPTHRTMEMTWSVQDSCDAFLSPSQGKRADDDDNDDEEENKKAPALYYSVYGKQADAGKGESLELQGGYSPTVQGNEINLVCQVRIVSTHPQVPAAAATPVAATRMENEVEDDDDEVDDGVDYDELIALHEDAGLSVEELRRKYRTGESAEPPSKRPKTQEKDQDDDDDEDYCF
ncbi:hypothetical protein FisN_5Lh489 [Fistulifera solaris]|uniref:Uncharacterized protein n=1 Tax=Fistulifera solaris TaxID=1519565 RepID=A0A1Z5KH91_FISSO|nr:hypothetical protein FisN_5Lh489 [Fistulifera solaris]|eukprot:GAX25391.1 hypothetical protein FisN_5Lh489 [Fistulifera solaris]